MRRGLGHAFWIESALAAVTAGVAVLTLVWPDWIEGVSGYDPDHHNGSVEMVIVIVCAIAALVTGMLARRQWRITASLSPVRES